MTALFQADRLDSISAEGLPSEREFVVSIDTAKPSRNPPSLMLTPEQIQSLPKPQRPQPPASAPDAPPRSYPPLEPRP